MLLIVPLFALFLSFNFHSLWLLYDVSLIMMLMLLLYKGKSIDFYRLSVVFLIVGFSVFIYLLGGSFFDLYSVLSIWDSYKHLILIYFIYRFSFSVNFRFISVVLFCFFVFNFFFILYQDCCLHVDFDDLSGSFGDGSTHAVGFLAILVLAIFFRYQVIFTKLSFLKFLLLLFMVSYQAILVENYGFFAILLMVVVYIFFSIKKFYKNYFISFFMLMILFFSMSYDESLLLHDIKSRYLDVINTFDYISQSTYTNSRPSMMMYAYELGGFFGAGYGFFSNIYGMSGSGVNLLLNSELNISEFSHFLAESGLLGVFTVVALYLYAFNSLATDKLGKSFAFLLFLLCFLYARLLMDERLIFMLIFTTFFLFYNEKIKVRCCKIV
jgi:hypothetical protein